MNDSEEMEKIYREYATPLKRYVFSLCRNETIAEDIVADTFYKAIKNIESFHGGRMLTWLCAIARNTYLDYVKKKEHSNVTISEEMESYIPDRQPQPEKQFLEKEEKMKLYRMVQRLLPEERDVVYLRIFTNLSFKEIADILGKSENWARVIFYRSKNRMKGWIEHETTV